MLHENPYFRQLHVCKVAIKIHNFKKTFVHHIWTGIGFAAVKLCIESSIFKLIKVNKRRSHFTYAFL